MLFRHAAAAFTAALLMGALAGPAFAQQVQVKPWFFMVVDTSGSMNTTTSSNSCGYSSNRMGAARCAIRNILDSTGDAEFGLLQFNHGGTGSTCSNSCTDQSGPGLCSADEVGLEPITSNNGLVREWVDNSCTGNCASGGPRELYSGGSTPLGASMNSAMRYFQDQIASKPSPTATDVYAGCRPVNIILLTDGDENCGGSASSIATQFLTVQVPSPSGTITLRIRTYIIGFGISPGNGNIEAVAAAGDTDAPGPHRGFYANDEETLSAALNAIIIDSQVNEVCDGRDNDCDSLIDEDNPKFCDVNGIRTRNPLVLNSSGASVDQGSLDSRLATCTSSPCAAVSGTQGNGLCAQPEWAASSDPACAPANILCESPGEICNVEDDDCDGVVDEDAPVLPGSAEVCNDGTDNDCDGTIDENCSGCTPEICDGVDNDCDGTIDNITRPCGVDLGICTSGTETCVNGTWGACTGNPSGTEVCDNLDNDCDGVTDGITRVCGSNVGECQQGVERCTTGSWGTCTGDRGPSPEICDLLDNDCNPGTADGTDDVRIGRPCGSDVGVCSAGSYVCDPSGLTCSGAVLGSAETCNGLDDDCDGNVDEGVISTDVRVGVNCVVDNAGQVITTGGLSAQGQCVLGTSTCRGGAVACDGYVGPSPEQCDNQDHDCDGNPINGVDSTDPRVGSACGSANGICTPGTLQCVNFTLVCSAPVLPDTEAEVCNGLDEDCDGIVDEGNPGGGSTCDTTGHMGRGECTPGTTACIGGSQVCQGEVTPTPEECDGFDNDCDGNVDEGTPVGVGGPCGSDVGACESGQFVCVNGQLECPNDIGPSDELCDGFDNDCDGRTDETPIDVGGTCVPSGAAQPASCRRSTDPEDSSLPQDQLCGACKWGVFSCRNGQLQCNGYVGPRDELCNGLDDDCDYPCLRLDTDLDGTIDRVKCPASCDDPSDPDCDSKIDEGVATSDPNVGAACGSNDTGECAQGTQACEGGTYVCVGEVKPTVEVCNGLDDDCDGTVDDGIPVGNACGNDVGECQTGRNICDPSQGTLVCDGAVGPTSEVCDLLDNDCDGKVDEALGLGDACGSEEGECSRGRIGCDKGKEICVGEEIPQAETCDCLDNDCDGEVDEEATAGDLCPGTSACVMCQCALPCADGGEFGRQCPTGKAAVTVDDECRCVGSACETATCAAETLTDPDTDAVLCAPGSDTAGTCVCRENACTFRCDGKVCPSGLICDAVDGVCKVQSCLLAQFACSDGQRCDPSLLDCVVDECADADCDGPCREGKCFSSCNLKQPCGPQEVCHDGKCELDPCAKANCGAGKACYPETGECVDAPECVSSGCSDGFVCDIAEAGCIPDPCLSTRCGSQDICAGGECVARCPADQLACDDTCVDPDRSREFCGASADCTGRDRGETCADDAVCSKGECKDSCDTGFVACDGGCVDPMTDTRYCGATDKCDQGEAGESCAPGESCTAGVCMGMFETGAGGNASGAGGDSEVENRKLVLGTGGSACACSVPGAPQRGLHGTGWLALLGAVWAIGYRARRRRLLTWPRGASLWLLLLLVAALQTSGCTVDPYCVNCPDKDDPSQSGSSGGAGPGDGTGGSGAGGNGGSGGMGSGSVLGGGGNTGGDGGSPESGGNGTGGEGSGCKAETCNGQDDDCDDKVDEGVDAAGEGIDLQTDPNNCGSCGNACELASAFAVCLGGECAVASCDVGYVDLDQEPGNGCELRCTKTADDDTRCDQRDNDCDGKVDEDIDFESDADNCSSCGFSCGFPHAEQAECMQGACVLRAEDCDADYYDVNGAQADGCEYFCVPTGGGELCNRRDDDCDGQIDESVATDDPAVGEACGTDTGECQQGVQVCGTGAQAGQIVCQGEVIPDTEVCDSRDNDCDGQVDEEDNAIGATCGSNVGVCQSGTIQCTAGSLQCTGAVLGSAGEVCDGQDNDCDGKFDETPGDVGAACSTQSGSLDTNPPAAVGTCALGMTACAGGGLSCVGEIGPGTEVCDNRDNDCDGRVDEADPSLNLPCGNTRGECSAGTWACFAGALQCNGGQTPVAETCNARDDDCDGRFDEGVAATDSRIGVNCGSAVGECTRGATQCVSGTVACIGGQGPRPELCDDRDWDCDGQLLENLNDSRIGQVCPGNGTGACDPGVYACTGGALACVGVIGPTAELCDGIDNDCDGIADDGADEPTRGQACGSSVGACQAGTMACVAGSMQCTGQVIPQPETCDATTPFGLTDPENDDDCDGNVDEDFELDTNPQYCGFCNVRCSVPNAISQCVSGACQIAACQSGYHGSDCSIGPCQINGAEVCNGRDDDCNGVVDDDLSTPTCNTVGACAGAVAQCTGADGWACSIAPVSEICNGADDDCDGRTDEGFSLGTSCAAPGVGACATRGTLACDPTDTSRLATRCESSPGVPAATGTPGSELCNGMDDDCDGTIDEPCPPGTNNSGCVTDNWVTLASGTQVYAYEASRPDATASGSGTRTARACSASGRLPWTNVTYLDALAACQAAGARLCLESEWEEACTDDAGGTCYWPYPTLALCDQPSDYQGNRCNGVDWNAIPTIQAGGLSGQFGQCYRSRSGTAADRIYELSGNVKEYVMQRGSGAIPVRGGAHNNLQNGLSCGFDFSVWPDNSPFSNVGFRCCRSTAALPAVCGTISGTGLAVTGSTVFSNSLTVTNHGTVTSLEVTGLSGTISNFREITRMELIAPDGTTAVLFDTDASNCLFSNRDNWNLNFVDGASRGWPPAFTDCGNSSYGVGENRDFRPRDSLTATFVGMTNPEGDWTLRITDSVNNSTNGTLNSWGLRICVDQN